MCKKATTAVFHHSTEEFSDLFASKIHNIRIILPTPPVNSDVVVVTSLDVFEPATVDYIKLIIASRPYKQCSVDPFHMYVIKDNT